MVDRRAMTGPGGVVFEDEKHLDTFKMAQIKRSKGAQMWLQINHPVAKCKPILVSRRGHHQLFHLILAKCQIASNTPIEMTESMIAEVIQFCKHGAFR